MQLQLQYPNHLIAFFIELLAIGSMIRLPCLKTSLVRRIINYKRDLFNPGAKGSLISRPLTHASKVNEGKAQKKVFSLLLKSESKHVLYAGEEQAKLPSLQGDPTPPYPTHQPSDSFLLPSPLSLSLPAFASHFSTFSCTFETALVVVVVVFGDGTFAPIAAPAAETASLAGGALLLPGVLPREVAAPEVERECCGVGAETGDRRMIVF